MKKILYFLFLVLLVACTDDEPNPIPDQLAELKDNIPENWTVTVRADQYPSGTTTILTEEPNYVALFVNKVEVFSDSVCDGYLNPTFILNFYPIADKQAVIDSIDAIYFYNPCLPEVYGETDEFIAVTTKCFKNHGCTSSESVNALAPLNTALRKYFEDLQN